MLILTNAQKDFDKTQHHFTIKVIKRIDLEKSYHNKINVIKSILT